MADKRIPTTPAALRDVLTTAINGISHETNWPTTAPTTTQCAAAMGSITSHMALVDSIIAQLSISRETLRNDGATAFELMKKIDAVTDGLYGPSSPRKLDYGLPPKKDTKGSAALKQVIIKHVSDGDAPGSIRLQWETINNAAAYQIQWFSDAALTVPVGNAAVSKSEFQVEGLTIKTQYWIRIRAIRGDQHGSWSDQATRVANI